MCVCIDCFTLVILAYPVFFRVSFFSLSSFPLSFSQSANLIIIPYLSILYTRRSPRTNHAQTFSLTTFRRFSSLLFRETSVWVCCCCCALLKNKGNILREYRLATLSVLLGLIGWLVCCFFFLSVELLVLPSCNFE